MDDLDPLQPQHRITIIADGKPILSFSVAETPENDAELIPLLEEVLRALKAQVVPDKDLI
jgi:hypothetical protein